MAGKVGLALGGGGVRGLANIGAMKALLEAGIVPDFVAGTSMGAIVGSLYADSLDIGAVERTIRALLDSKEFRRRSRCSRGLRPGPEFLRQGLRHGQEGVLLLPVHVRESVVSAGAFFSEMDRIVPDKNFSGLRIPFACMALDIVSGLPMIIRSGPLRIAVKASSAVPGILPPVPIDGRVCVDGGWAESVPISAARVLGARFVVAVDVSRDVEPINYKEEIRNSMDILMRAGDVSRLLMNTLRVRDADFVIHPEVGTPTGPSSRTWTPTSPGATGLHRRSRRP